MLYIGQTNNVMTRVERHNKGYNKFTRNKGPWNLLCYKNFSTRSEAMALEKKLKAFKNREWILEWVARNLGTD
jgi:putative endonuclease